MRGLVQQLMVRVRARVGKDAELVALIAPLLGGKVYSTQIVSGWRKGHDRMPAEVLLAACQVTGVSVDEVLFGEALATRQDRLEKELAELRSRIEGSTRITLIAEAPPESPHLG